MNLLDLQFIGFVLSVFFLYFIAPRSLRWVLLLIANFVFYWLVGGWLSALIVGVTSLICWIGARILGHMRSRKVKRGLLRVPLVLSLLAIFSMLLLFRHAGFIFPRFNLLMVVGISFYAFQATGYLVDVYVGRVSPEGNVFKTALFLSFFPQLVQGPIARHSEVAKDLFAGHAWNWDRARSGIQRIIWGYFMKLVVADRAAMVVGTVLGAHTDYGGAVIFFALFLYSVQIYADFAGGISVTLGIAQILGVVKLPENFRQPFFAISVGDFWRRWHMSLGSWLRDYLFYPITISKPMGKLSIAARKRLGLRIGKILPVTIATYVIFIVIGIWHGASWQGLVFGLSCGTIIAASQFFEPNVDKLCKKLGIRRAFGFWRLFAIGRTILIMVLLRYFTLSPSLPTALSMLRRTFSAPNLGQLRDGTLFSLGLERFDYIVLFAGFGIILLYDFIAERYRAPFAALDEKPKSLQFLLTFLLIAAITIFGIYASEAFSAAFIYGQL